MSLEIIITPQCEKELKEFPLEVIKDFKMKKYKNSAELAHALGLPAEVGQLSDLKAKLTKEIIKNIAHQELTHLELSHISGVPRSAITGIISGSMQKVY